jgi:predicted TPR repeat methyltransferase
MLLKAIATHRAGRTSEARVMYQRILRRRPHDPDALNFLGMLEYQAGGDDGRKRGIELLHQSVRSLPGNPHAWTNLGNMLMGFGDSDGAVDAYARATELAPDMWQAWFNRATCLRRLRRLEESIECLKTAINLKPEHDVAYERLGLLLYRVGKTRELVDLYRDWVRYNPQNPTARHMYAAVAGGSVPDRASDEYVRSTFDGFADRFDENLSDLGYRAPQLVAEAVSRHRSTQDAVRRDHVLDAGAGTGLCGPLLRANAGRLVGVDLSGGMLQKARSRGIYDELVEMELCAFMRSRPASYDVVVSADTLVYFGALEAPLEAAGICLRPGGLLVFTVEYWQDADSGTTFRMDLHGRYLHAQGYVDSALRAARLEPVKLTQVVLRSELGTDVQGLLVVAAPKECGVTVRSGPVSPL